MIEERAYLESVSQKPLLKVKNDLNRNILIAAGIGITVALIIYFSKKRK